MPAAGANAVPMPPAAGGLLPPPPPPPPPPAADPVSSDQSANASKMFDEINALGEGGVKSKI